MILVDLLGHMVSDKSVEELHAFARILGLKRQWFQTRGNTSRYQHYDLTSDRMIEKAIKFEAKLVKSSELFRRTWWYGL